MLFLWFLVVVCCATCILYERGLRLHGYAFGWWAGMWIRADCVVACLMVGIACRLV